MFLAAYLANRDFSENMLGYFSAGWSETFLGGVRESNNHGENRYYTQMDTQKRRTNLHKNKERHW